MLLDKQNIMVDAMLLTAVPAAATTIADTIGTTGQCQSLDLGAAGRHLDNMRVMCQITGGVPAAGTSLAVQLVTGAAAATATAIVGTSAAISLADLILLNAGTYVYGNEIAIDINPSAKLLRFLTVQFVQVGIAFTGTTTITVALVPECDLQTAQV